MAKREIQIADKPTLDKIQSVLENSVYGLNVLRSILDKVNTNTADVKSVVKSVQRGTFEFNASTGIGDMSITISPINTDKAICILDSAGLYYFGGGSIGNQCWVKKISADSLVLAIHPDTQAAEYDRPTYGSWQIIEFC